jgi:hypothetical protein
MLDYRRFSTFVKSRSAKVLEAVKKRLEFSDKDFIDSEEA